MDDSGAPRATSHKLGVDMEQLMLSLTESKNQQRDCQDKDSESNEEQDMAVRNDNHFRSKSRKAGSENWRENETSDYNENWRELTIEKKVEDGHEKSDEEDVVNGPNKTKVKPKIRK